MLFAAPYEGRFVFVSVFFGVAILAMLIFSPALIVRELRRPVTEELPEWMGSARARKIRLAVALFVVGLLGEGMLAAVLLT